MPEFKVSVDFTHHLIIFENSKIYDIHKTCFSLHKIPARLILEMPELKVYVLCNMAWYFVATNLITIVLSTL